jgi:hypothetical protein
MPRFDSIHPVTIAITIIVTLLTASEAQSQSTPEPSGTTAIEQASDVAQVCRVGLAVEAIHNMDLGNGTFVADFWIWSVCPIPSLSPLTTMEFTNANSISISMADRTMTEDMAWDYAKVSGTFRHEWDLSRFPFDRQTLRIEMEDTANLASEFVYEADPGEPVPEPDSVFPNWQLTDATLEASSHTYRTTYGDPRDPDGTTEYPELTLSLTFERNDLLGFFKLTFVVYIAFLISLLSYFLNLRNPTILTARMSVISGTLFAVAVSMRTATSALSTESGLTMVDMIHIAALVAILIDAIAALITQLLIEQGRSADSIVRFNRVVMITVVVGFVTANILLIGRAGIG